MTGWGGTEWEDYCVLLLRCRYGNRLVPVPDKSGGDGGLDAYVVEGTAWQAYAPENEPLRPAVRYELQRNKITTDLGKLDKYRDRVQEILGETILHEWILVTPRHESADLVVHCNRQADRVRAFGLPFIDNDRFRVFVQSLTDFAIEHRALQRAGQLPGDLMATSEPPLSDEGGNPFSMATGPLITVMDDKLRDVIAAEQERAWYRGELLSNKVAGDDLVARFDERVPDVAQSIRSEVGAAKRAMLRRQATGASAATHLDEVREDVIQRVLQACPELGRTRAEQIALAWITQWLQECSMRFGSDARVDA